jgi:hypothetical protein
MKKVILALAIVFGISAAGHAQMPSGKKNDQMKSMVMKNGVKVVNDKPMLCKNGKCAPLTQTYTCSDGCKVSTDGTVTKPDGTSMKLMAGYQIDKSGKVSMISHGQQGHVCTDSCPMHGKM